MKKKNEKDSMQSYCIQEYSKSIQTKLKLKIDPKNPKPIKIEIH